MQGCFSGLVDDILDKRPKSPNYDTQRGFPEEIFNNFSGKSRQKITRDHLHHRHRAITFDLARLLAEILRSRDYRQTTTIEITCEHLEIQQKYKKYQARFLFELIALRVRHLVLFNQMFLSQLELHNTCCLHLITFAFVLLIFLI